MRPRRASLGAVGSWLCTRWNLSCAVALGFLAAGWALEERLYDGFVVECTRPGMPEETKALALLAHTHEVLDRRRALGPKDDRPVLDALARWPGSGAQHLAEPYMDCGSYTTVFVESCQRAGIPARVCQLWTGGEIIHILAEVRLDGRWVVADPICNGTIRDRQGQLVGFREVLADWEYYRARTPRTYTNKGHDPERATYTNWSKVPVVLPAAKGVLTALVGPEWVEGLCLRAYVLNRYRAYFVGLLLLTLGVNALRLAWRWRAVSLSRRLLVPSGRPGWPGEPPTPR